MVNDKWDLIGDLVHQRIGRILDAAPVSVDELEWGGYFVVDTDTREVVGSCAFKGEPIDDGTVEIAYFTYPEFEGKGYATCMALKLIELAGDLYEGQASDCAHTARSKRLDARVLEKVAMSFVGEVIEPDDGRVWKWQRQIRT